MSSLPKTLVDIPVKSIVAQLLIIDELRELADTVLEEVYFEGSFDAIIVLLREATGQMWYGKRGELIDKYISFMQENQIEEPKEL